MHSGIRAPHRNGEADGLATGRDVLRGGAEAEALRRFGVFLARLFRKALRVRAQHVLREQVTQETLALLLRGERGGLERAEARPACVSAQLR